MAHPRLRIYYGPQDDQETDTLPATLPIRPTVSLPLSDVLPLLADAVQDERIWLNDFADDEITISSDLYEVLLSYQHYRRPSA